MASEQRPRHKYKAQACERDGYRFPSKREAKHYDTLVQARDCDDPTVSFFLRQVPLHLPGGVKLVVDFVTFWMDGTVTFEDPKGHRTESYKAKKRMVEALYPIKITEF